jgi:hypothetical protein
VNHEVVAQLVEEITTRAGLTVNAKLDKRQHPAHMKVMAVETASVKLGSYVSHGGGLIPSSRAGCKYRSVDGLVARAYSSRLVYFSLRTVTLDWLVPLNQPVSLPTSSQP